MLRRRSIGLLRRRPSSPSAPFMLVGGFNVAPDAACPRVCGGGGPLAACLRSPRVEGPAGARLRHGVLRSG
eukprot:9757015-Alexandrium_andersonii.AAC.1